MLVKLYDVFDDMSIYVTENKERLAKQNIRRLRYVSMFSLIGCIVFWVYAYLTFLAMNWSIGYIGFPLYFFVVWNIAYRFGDRIAESYDRTRIFCLAFYIIYAAMAIQFDFGMSSTSGLHWFPMLMMGLTAVYVDYYFATIALYVLLVCIYICAFIYAREAYGLHGDLILIIFNFFAASIAYGMNLSIQTDRGADSREYKEQSVTDLLTGLLNKVAFQNASKRYLEKRGAEPKGSLIILDFDNFKNVNDSYGHQTGDEVLEFFGTLLYDNFRVSDILGRVGGDEFMVFVTGEVSEENIANRCEKIQHELAIARIGDAHGFSCSIGIAVDDVGIGFDELYSVADHALYRAKENGKACHVLEHASGEEP